MDHLNICLCKVCDCKYDRLELLNKIKKLESELEFFENNSTLNPECTVCNKRDSNVHECEKCFFLLCDNCFEIVYDAEEYMHNNKDFKWNCYLENPTMFPFMNKYTELLKKYDLDYINFCKHYDFK